MIGISEIFKIGIGPSSSHTVGPMKSAASFAQGVLKSGHLDRVTRVRVDLYGSLAWTGKGHGTDKAVLLGLSGKTPEAVDPDEVGAIVARVRDRRQLRLADRRVIGFSSDDVVFDGTTAPPHHPNTLAFTAFADDEIIAHERWCSVGGGFVVREYELDQPPEASKSLAPFPFRSGDELLAICEANGLTIAEAVLANEISRWPKEQVEEYLDNIIEVMMRCIERGMVTEGELPGGLHVQRRAPNLRRKLDAAFGSNNRSAHEVMDWVSLCHRCQ